MVLARPGVCVGGVLLLVVFLIASFAAVLRPAGAVVAREGFVVSEAGGDKVTPSVSGGLAVWDDRRGGNSDVYGRKLSPAKGEEFAITTHPANQRRPAVSGDFVVWEDDRNGNWDIYGKDLAVGAEEIPIVVAPGDQRKPKISGKKLVWEDTRKVSETVFDLDVYYKDLANDPPESAGREIPAPAGNQTNPDISGDTVVWEDDRTGEKNVYGKDLGPAGGGEFPIGTGGAWQEMPAISGTIVVWQQENGGNFDIFGKDLMAKDLETGQVFQITDNAADQWAPAISGTIVVWCDARNGNSDAYGKDLATGREFVLTRDASPQDAPAIDGETVVWEDQNVDGTGFGAWNIHGSNLDPAPAAPTGLVAKIAQNGVSLAWNPPPDADVDGYDVYRASAKDGPYVKLNAAPLPASATPSYLDETPLPEPGSSSFYRVKARDVAGSESVAAEASITTPVPPPTTTPEPPAPQPPTPQPPAPQPPTPQPPAPVVNPTPPQVVISNPNPVVPVRKTIRITVKKLGAHTRAAVTVFRNGKVVAKRTVAADSGFAFKPSAAGRYTVKANVPNASHSKTFRAR